MQFIKSILFGALVLLLSATVAAQGDRGGRRGFDLAKMTERLDLSPEQTTQLKSIHEEQRTAFAKLAEGLPEGERPDREKKQALLQESREKMMKVLTAEQQEKLATERHNHKGKGKHKSKMNESLRSDLRAYRSETIIPKFVEVRTAFDTKLSTTERTQVSTLREAVKSELGERGFKQMTSRNTPSHGKHCGTEKGHRQAVCAKPSADTPSKKSANHEEHRTKMQDFMQKHESDVNAVRDIVRSHQSELIAVRAELDAAKLQWKKDGDAIRAKHLSPEQLSQYKARCAKRNEKTHQKCDEGDRNSKHEEGHTSFGRSDRGAFTFLLMAPAQMADESFEELASEKLSVYPNPATDQTTLKFEIRSTGPVRVELIDVSGKVLKIVLEGDREAKTYELPVTLPANMGKTGLLRVTDTQGIRTVQVSRG